MEHQKNLLNEPNDFKFVTRRWNIVNDQSNTNDDVRNEVIYNTEVLKYIFFYYSDAYILVRGDITVIAAPVTQVAFKNCTPFIRCITKIGGTTIDDAEDLDLVMPMYNMIECSPSYFETTGSLWIYSKDEATNFNVDIANNDFHSFEYKAKLLGNTVAQPTPNHVNGILKKCSSCCAIKIFE